MASHLFIIFQTAGGIFKKISQIFSKLSQAKQIRTSEANSKFLGSDPRRINNRAKGIINSRQVFILCVTILV